MNSNRTLACSTYIQWATIRSRSWHFLWKWVFGAGSACTGTVSFFSTLKYRHYVFDRKKRISLSINRRGPCVYRIMSLVVSRLLLVTAGAHRNDSYRARFDTVQREHSFSISKAWNKKKPSFLFFCWRKRRCTATTVCPPPALPPPRRRDRATNPGESLCTRSRRRRPA